MAPRYLVRARAERDLEDQAFYYGTVASAELAYRFLVAAHECFTLLAEFPNLGWKASTKHPELRNMRVYRIKGFKKMLVLYSPFEDGIDVLRVVHGSRNLEILLRGTTLN